MKKFYTLALATAVTLSASAVSRTLNELAPAKKQTGVSVLKMVKKSDASSLKKSEFGKVSNIREAAPAADLAGEYTITIGDYYFQSSINGTYEADCSVEVSGTTVTFTCDDFVDPVKGTYDETAGTVTFDFEKLGAVSVSGTTYYEQFEPFEWVVDPSTQKGSITPKSYSVTYSDGAFNFPADHGFSWPAYSDVACKNRAGYFGLFDVVSIVKKPDTDSNEGWTDLGKALFADPWVLPAFNINALEQTQYQFEVALQQNDADKNVYRLVDPYKGNVFAQVNSSTKGGYIEFNVSDPEHVTFSAVDAGFANSQLGVTKFYCLNYLSWAAGYLGEDPANVVGLVDMPYTTFKDGVITLSSIETTETDETTGAETKVTMYDAVFGVQGDIYGGYNWQDKDENLVPALGFIDMSSALGVGSVISDNDSVAPVHYFNLQGIEVSEPVAGQLTIRVQGSKATKILVK